VKPKPNARHPRTASRKSESAQADYRTGRDSSDNEGMPFNALVTNAGRLRILAALAGAEGRDLEFVELRQETELTDGNLASHARRLQDAGLIAIQKELRDNKPVTSYRLTNDGRTALESHVRALMQAILPREPAAAAHAAMTSSHDDEWID